MRCVGVHTWTWLLAAFVALALPGEAAGQGTSPPRPEGRPWRIGYLEGGPFEEYAATLAALAEALARKGLLPTPVFPPDRDPRDAERVWRSLAERTAAGEGRLEFVADAFYSGGWSDTPGSSRRVAVKEEILRRLAPASGGGRPPDLDLVLAMGTWAGQDLANDRHRVPVLVLAASDPLGSGIVRDATDSGRDWLHARLTPERYRNQLRLFHDLIPFRRLGLVHEDSEEGRLEAALEDVLAVGRERGFETRTCAIPPLVAEGNTLAGDQAREAEAGAVAAIMACHEGFARAGEGRVDAVYLAEHPAVPLSRLEELTAPLHARRIPTFGMRGEMARHGAMLAIAQAGQRWAGDWHAWILAQVIQGASPRSLPMRFEDPLKLALHLASARQAGYDPPLDVLALVEEWHGLEPTSVSAPGGELPSPRIPLRQERE